MKTAFLYAGSLAIVLILLATGSGMDQYNKRQEAVATKERATTTRETRRKELDRLARQAHEWLALGRMK